jgi:hypothetical protein
MSKDFTMAITWPAITGFFASGERIHPILGRRIRCQLARLYRPSS